MNNGVVYIGSNDDDLYAFDAAGSRHRSGSPTICHPLWTGVTAGPVESAPAVADGTVYVGSDGPNTLYDGDLYAFDASGPHQLFGISHHLQPSVDWGGSWRCTGLAGRSGWYVYVTELGHIESGLDAFDAAGNTNCSGTPSSATLSGRPRPCTRPLWQWPTAWSTYQRRCLISEITDEAGDIVSGIQSSNGYNSSPIVANGIVYAGVWRFFGPRCVRVAANTGRCPQERGDGQRHDNPGRVGRWWR